jgi:hypothetical protein
MEEAEEEGPDLFDIKFLRDELLYYSRDENQFLRRRRTFVFALSDDLVATRFKDPDLPFQRGVLMLGTIVVAVRRLAEWLSTDALAFEVVFTAGSNEEPLAAERALLEILLREPIANGTARVLQLAPADLAAHCKALARRSLCRCLVMGTDPAPLHAAEVIATRLRIDGPRPALGDDDETPAVPDADDAAESWGRALEQVLARWL